MRHITEFKKQNGLAMIVALLVLIALTLIVLSGSRNTTMQLRMASNMQSRIDALETAQAGLDYAVTIPPIDIPSAAQVLCTVNNPDGYSCYPDNLDLPAPMVDDSGGTSSLVLVRDNLSQGSGCPREGTSIATFSCSYFKAISTFDNTGSGQGKSVLVTGLIKKKLN